MLPAPKARYNTPLQDTSQRLPLYHAILPEVPRRATKRRAAQRCTRARSPPNSVPFRSVLPYPNIFFFTVLTHVLLLPELRNVHNASPPPIAPRASEASRDSPPIQSALPYPSRERLYDSLLVSKPCFYRISSLDPLGALRRPRSYSDTWLHSSDQFIALKTTSTSIVENVHIQNWPLHCVEITSASSTTITGLTLNNTAGNVANSASDGLSAELEHW